VIAAEWESLGAPRLRNAVQRRIEEETSTLFYHRQGNRALLFGCSACRLRRERARPDGGNPSESICPGSHHPWS
jgi:hypothetical protein